MIYSKHFKNGSDLYSVGGNVAPLLSALTSTPNGFKFENETLAIETKFTKHPSGVIERCDVLKNVSDKPVTLTSAQSKFIFNGGEYEVYTQYSEWCGEAEGKWQYLN